VIQVMIIKVALYSPRGQGALKLCWDQRGVL